MSIRVRAGLIALIALAVLIALVGVVLPLSAHHKAPVAVAPPPGTSSPTPAGSEGSAPTPGGSSPTPGGSEGPSPSPQAVPPRPVVPPRAVVPSAAGGLRVGITYGDTLPSLSDADLGSTLDGAVALGVGWIRIDLAWNDIQPNSAADAAWTGFDRVVAAAGARNLTVLPVVGYTPGWARPAGCTTPKCHPADDGQFAVFAAAAVARYGPLGVHTWEIWNEPNSAHYWSPVADVGQYVHLLRASVDAMKAADPAAVIISGGLAPKSTGSGNIAQLDFLRTFCSQGGTQLVNAIGFHPYSYPVPPGYSAKWNAWQQIDTTATSFRSILNSCGAPGIRVWVTEYGAPTAGSGRGATAPNYGIASHPIADHVSEALQAQMATDSVRLARDSSTIVGLFWYTYSDTAGGGQKNSFGLRHNDGSAKPAYTALQKALAAAAQGG